MFSSFDRKSIHNMGVSVSVCVNCTESIRHDDITLNK